MSKFKIQGIGLDTSTIDYKPENLYENFDYVYTSIRANNDYLVSDAISSIKKTPTLIVSTDYLDNINIGLEEHLKALDRKFCQLLLVDAGANWAFTSYLLNDECKALYENIGIENPKDLDQLKELIEKAGSQGIKIEYVSIHISPFEFNKELIEFCVENKITILGTNPMGGYLSANRNIETFSVPYLLGFAANYADIVFLSGRNLVKASDDLAYLTELIGTEAGNEYTLSKSVYKPVKPLKKAIYTSIQLGNKTIVPYDCPELCVDPRVLVTKIGSYVNTVKKISGKKKLESTADLETEGTEPLDAETENFLKLLYYPSDGTLEDCFAIARYKVLNFLRVTLTKAEGWDFQSFKIGNNILLITASKEPKVEGFLIWKNLKIEKPREFMLVFPDKDKDSIIFQELVHPEQKELLSK